MTIGQGGRVRFNGMLRERLVAQHPVLETGFAVGDLEAVCYDLLQLRDRLIATP